MPRDLASARLRKQGLSEEQVQQIKKDKEEAERLAMLTAAASARGAAPLPPGKGGPAPSKPARSAAPATVTKYRAIDGHEGELSFAKGATLFVVGAADGAGMVQAVSAGKAGKCPFNKLAPITPELLEQERIQRDKDLEEAIAQEEEQMRQEMEAMKLKHAEDAAKATPSAPGKPGEKSAELLAYEAKLDADFQAERANLKAEEDKLKAEAARIEAMLAALDD